VDWTKSFATQRRVQRRFDYIEAKAEKWKRFDYVVRAALDYVDADHFSAPPGQSPGGGQNHLLRTAPLCGGRPLRGVICNAKAKDEVHLLRKGRWCPGGEADV
jgi:hypothetical protein